VDGLIEGKMIRFFCVTLLWIISQPLVARENKSVIKFDFSARSRYESWRGMNARTYGDNSEAAIGEMNDDFVYQRLIAGFVWLPGSSITISMHMQDSRAFGWSLRQSQYPDAFRIGEKGKDDASYIMNPGEEFLEIYDAFIELCDVLPNLMMTIGRQKIFFGDNRIFGPGEWGNTGRWNWDALKLTWRKNNQSVDLFAGGTKIHDPLNAYLPLQNTEYYGGGIYAHFKLLENLDIEPFFAIKQQGSAAYIREQDINRKWWGSRIHYSKAGLILDGTMVKQWGSENQKPVDAWAFFAKAGYRFLSLPAKPILSIGESYATGVKDSKGIIRTFDPVYGAADRYYGRMNLTKWSNLDNREIVLELFPSDNLWVELKYNRFLIPEPDNFKLLQTLKLVKDENHLGDEFDVFISWQVHSKWQLVGAYGYFWAGKIEPINDQPAGNASMLAVQLNFTL
jgi:hypothetical protein